MHLPIIFLHIPKTAGQSVHNYLSRSFKEEDICPARENYQLCAYPLKIRKNFKLFSGHLDWSQVYGLHADAFTFSILRDPLDRILSFYSYLRREAGLLSLDELRHPANAGFRAIIELSADEYILGAPPEIRSFLDAHYDNFYSYYFAGRTYLSRNDLLGEVNAGKLTFANIIEIAKQNIKELNGLYRVDRLDKLQADLLGLGYSPEGLSLSETRVNVGSGDTKTRIIELKELGLTDKGLQRIYDMCEMDMKIWSDDDLFT
jgi:hypothetical protein